jgi:hypothetical protein
VAGVSGVPVRAAPRATPPVGELVQRVVARIRKLCFLDQDLRDTLLYGIDNGAHNSPNRIGYRCAGNPGGPDRLPLLAATLEGTRTSRSQVPRSPTARQSRWITPVRM